MLFRLVTLLPCRRSSFPYPSPVLLPLSLHLSSCHHLSTCRPATIPRLSSCSYPSTCHPERSAAESKDLIKQTEAQRPFRRASPLSLRGSVRSRGNPLPFHGEYGFPHRGHGHRFGNDRRGFLQPSPTVLNHYLVRPLCKAEKKGYTVREENPRSGGRKNRRTSA